MNEPRAPVLELSHVSVTLTRTRAAPSLHAPRDLPDLARFLWSTLARGAEERITALSDIDLRQDGGCLALLGEEGAGKTALVLLLARALSPSDGVVRLDGVDVHGARGPRARRTIRRGLQIVLDDIEGGLDPRLTVRASLELWASVLQLAAPTQDALAALMARVDLDARVLDVRAGALAPGQLKRVAIARALLAEPRVIVLDEPTRGLDPSERGAVLVSLARLVSQCTLVVATRDLALARAIATRVAVLSRGALIELDDADRVFFAPGHDVTRALVTAAPAAPRAGARAPEDGAQAVSVDGS